jgi:hypothetical protein
MFTAHHPLYRLVRRFVCHFAFGVTVLVSVACSGTGNSDALIESLVPQNDIVVVDGTSVRFTVSPLPGKSFANVFWVKILPNGSGIGLEGLTTATVSIPFTMADNGSSIYVGVTTPEGATDSAATRPIRVTPK